jgi:HAD superfamily hydrolase (TIGR01509 family)
MPLLRMKRAASTGGSAGKKAPAFRGLIFDCDGVLFDSKDANTAYYNHIRHAVNLPSLTEAEAAYSHMASSEEVLENLIPPALLPQALEVQRNTRYRDIFMGMMQPAPHVFHFLQTMREKGLPLGMCTNRSDSVHQVLNHFGMADFFSPVMTISHAPPKPDPEGLCGILAQWDAPAESVVFIGDSLVDQQAAASAGIPFWSFNSPDLAAQMHISSFREMEDTVALMLMQ